MKKNDSYNYIANYLLEHKNDLPEEELRFLINYLAKLREQGIENKLNPNKKDIINDLARLNQEMKSGELTSLTFDRLERELVLYNKLINNEDLVDISYELDKLYMENDMPIRDNSVLVRKLKDFKTMKGCKK